MSRCMFSSGTLRWLQESRSNCLHILRCHCCSRWSRKRLNINSSTYLDIERRSGRRCVDQNWKLFVTSAENHPTQKTFTSARCAKVQYILFNENCMLTTKQRAQGRSRTFTTSRVTDRYSLIVAPLIVAPHFSFFFP